jgi:hypothetical protein
MMSDFEMSVAGEVMDFAFGYFTGKGELTTEEMVNTYWDNYFNSCEMKNPETGLEMPHEETYDHIFYYPGSDAKLGQPTVG